MRSERKYRYDASGQLPLSLYEQIKLSQLCDVAVRLDKRGAIPATSSNFSLRRNGESLLISRSGKHKRLLTPSDFLLVDFQGKPCAAVAPKPSDETLLHALIYKQCPWIQSVIHCHAPELEALAPPSAQIEGHELLKALGAPGHESPWLISVFKNNQDMKVLAEQVDKQLFKKSKHGHGPVMFVLAQHGVYCGGETVERAETYLESLLHLLKHSKVIQNK